MQRVNHPSWFVIQLIDWREQGRSRLMDVDVRAAAEAAALTAGRALLGELLIVPFMNKQL